jgi:hypothetical protein
MWASRSTGLTNQITTDTKQVYCGKPNFADLPERGEFGPTCVWYSVVRKDLFAWGRCRDGDRFPQHCACGKPNGLLRQAKLCGSI